MSQPAPTYEALLKGLEDLVAATPAARNYEEHKMATALVREAREGLSRIAQKRSAGA